MITRILAGHTSPETAYLVDDYPYGFRLRCKIRYWLETATKGTKVGQTRCIAQTTNPKRSGEHWNTPKGSTYAECMLMYLDEQGHVQYLTVTSSAKPRLLGTLRRFWTDLTPQQQQTIIAMEQQSRQVSWLQAEWAAWDTAQSVDESAR